MRIRKWVEICKKKDENHHRHGLDTESLCNPYLSNPPYRLWNLEEAPKIPLPYHNLKALENRGRKMLHLCRGLIPSSKPAQPRRLRDLALDARHLHHLCPVDIAILRRHLFLTRVVLNSSRRQGPGTLMDQVKILQANYHLLHHPADVRCSQIATRWS
jgi:hypothetical protein